MKIVSLVSGIGAGGTGFKAAYEWWQSSKVEIKADAHTRMGGGAMALATTPWVAGALDAFKETARLNTKAARWTALSVALATIGSVASAIVALFS